jgi:hypothetical protein
LAEIITTPDGNRLCCKQNPTSRDAESGAFIVAKLSLDEVATQGAVQWEQQREALKHKMLVNFT